MYEAWLAMGIDCDGCISIFGPKEDSVGISFSNTIERLATTFMARVEQLNCRTSTSHTPLHTGNVSYTVLISGTQADPGTEDKLRFLKAILPHLVGKREKAERAIAILEGKLLKKYEHNPLNFMAKNVLYSTQEIADAMSSTYNTIYERFAYLHRKGRVQKKKKGHKTFWRLP